MRLSKVHGALVAVALLFSLNYLFSKLGMRAFAPMTFAWLRVAGASVILALLARSETPLAREDARRANGWAVLAVIVNQSLFLVGLSMTTIAVAAILITTIPVFTLGIAILARQERATAPRVGGIALAGAGALLVVGGESIAGTWRSVLGAVMIVMNCLCYSTYLVVSKRHMSRLSVRRVVARMFVVGAFGMFPLAAWSLWREDWANVPPPAWLILVLVILGPTVMAYLLQAWMLRHADSSVVASQTFIQPVLATLLGVIFLGEPLRAIVVIAGLMIFAGVWLATTPRAERA